jgi:hypothetical protein
VWECQFDSFTFNFNIIRFLLLVVAPKLRMLIHVTCVQQARCVKSVHQQAAPPAPPLRPKYYLSRFSSFIWTHQSNYRSESYWEANSCPSNHQTPQVCSPVLSCHVHIIYHSLHAQVIQRVSFLWVSPPKRCTWTRHDDFVTEGLTVSLKNSSTVKAAVSVYV